MTRDAKAVLKQALALSEADRADLAGILLQSIEHAAETEVEQAWRQEVARRVAALEAGEVTNGAVGGSAGPVVGETG